MLGAVTTVMLGLVALFNANECWGGAAYAAAFLSRCAAVLGIVHCHRPYRVFGAGFAFVQCCWCKPLRLLSGKIPGTP